MDRSKYLRAFTISLALLPSFPALSDDLFDSIESESLDLEFITSARMVSSRQESPNALTKLDSDDLYKLGIDNLVDALRLTPGMLVMDVHGSNSIIGYHGSNVIIPRRMQVLYNSTALYRPGYSDIHWHRLPVDLKDLSSIEVVRGTSAVDYGSKAFTAAINLVPKANAIGPTIEAQNKLGSGDTSNTGVQHHSRFDNGNVFLRYFHRRNSGFDSTEVYSDLTDFSTGDSFLLSGDLNLRNGMVLDGTIATSDYRFEIPGFGTSATEKDESELDIVEFTFAEPSEEKNISGILKLNGAGRVFGRTVDWHASYNYSQYKRVQPMRFCGPGLVFDPTLEALDASPNIHFEIGDIPYMLQSSMTTGTASLNKSIINPLSENDLALLAELGAKIQANGMGVLSEVCGESNQSVLEKRHGGELQAVVKPSDTFTLSSTLAFNHTDVESETYLSGNRDRNDASWSNNMRYFITPTLVTNFGIMAETNSDIDDTHYSSRASLNYELFANHTARIAVSRSKRVLSIYETQREWNYRVVYDDGVVDYNNQTVATLPRTTRSNPDLEPEEINSIEFGYTWSTPLERQIFDIKVFHEKLENLVSEPFIYFFLDQSNNGATDIKGAEFSYTHRDLAGILGWSAGMNYTYLDNDANNLAEKSLYSRHSGTLWTIYPILDKTDFGFIYYGATDIGGSNYSRFDVTLSHSLKVGKSDLAIQFNYRRYPSVIGSYNELSIETPTRSHYDNNDRFFLTTSIGF